jgi:hypothetical protein
MSNTVKEWLKQMHLISQTTHEDRQGIDHQIEERTGLNCDYVLDHDMMTKEEFKRIVEMVLARRKAEQKKVLEKMAEEKVIV